MRNDIHRWAELDVAVGVESESIESGRSKSLSGHQLNRGARRGSEGETFNVLSI